MSCKLLTMLYDVITLNFSFTRIKNVSRACVNVQVPYKDTYLYISWSKVRPSLFHLINGVCMYPTSKNKSQIV